MVRSAWLAFEAFKASPPKIVLFENVPRILERGRELLDRVIATMQAYGYACQETVHDCGELGGLPAHRRRYLLVARRVTAVRPFLYEPPKKPMRTLGSAILSLPLPHDPAAGPMHQLPRLEWKTWLRLALIPPGGDWRDLQRWAPGTFTVERTPFNNVWRVLSAEEPAPTVTAGATPSAGGYSTVDPRLSDRAGRHSTKFHVAAPDAPARTVTGTMDVQAGAPSAVDPRLSERAGRHPIQYAVEQLDEPTRTITGARIGSGGQAAPDPRMSLPASTVTLRVRSLDAPAATVTGRSSVWDNGGQSAPDPRVAAAYRNGTLGVSDPARPAQTVVASADVWTVGSAAAPDPRVAASYFAGTFGVCELDAPAGAVTGHARESTGAFSAPDVRVGHAFGGSYGVAPLDRPFGTVTGGAAVTTGRFSVPEVRRLIDLPPFWPTWAPVLLSPHTGAMRRPLTTLELYVLQGFLLQLDPANPPRLAGRAVARWRKAIGNAVPPPAAQAVAETILRTLLANEQAQQILSFTPIWVRGMPELNAVLRVLAPGEYPPAEDVAWAA